MPAVYQDRVEFLVIGHVTRDLRENDPTCPDYTLGGTASFAAVTAAKLGHAPVVVTRAGPDVDLSVLKAIADVRVLASESTTTFANIYTPAGRVQYCYHPAPPILADELDADLHHPATVLLGPLVSEIGPDIPILFDEDTLVAAVPQGWMRSWDETGLVSPREWPESERFLPHLDALILSIEDIGFELSRLNPFIEHVPLVVLTQYRDGSTIYGRRDDGSRYQIEVPPRPANEVDPTGAGDTFATAFLLRLRESGDPVHSARYANVAASFGVEGIGVEAIPDNEEILNYMARHPWEPEVSL